MTVSLSTCSVLPRPEAVAADFRLELQLLEERYEKLWRATDDRPPILGPLVSPQRQRANRRASRRLIDELAAEIERLPSDEQERQVWRERVRERLHRFGEERLGWPRGYRSLLFGDSFYGSAVDFVRAARAFDSSIATDDLGQALRNVWIMNSLQMLLGLEVELTPSVFAYSMLYPLTDNYLDDVEVALEAKRELNHRLGLRLAGEPIEPIDDRQRQIFRMVGRIEAQYPREQFPRVHLSLEAIHRSQVASLSQASGDRCLDSDELLRLSIAKGGASVLADGYLVAGELTADEADFCYGYGVFLQLLDDLQDLAGDGEAGHATLFTIASGAAVQRHLEALTGRLHRFMRRIVEEAPRIAAPEYSDRKDLIVRNCTSLLVGAVAEHENSFSRSFARAVERRWPFRLAALRRLRCRAQKRYRKTAKRLQRQRGVESVLDLLG